MRQRCTNPNDPKYPDYGGRGIKVCERWESFENFFADMGEPPPGMTIDRRDNDGDYEPLNCRWATAKTQANNARSNVLLTLNGETLTAAQWGERLGLNGLLIRKRILRGWPVEKILATPRQKNGNAGSYLRKNNVFVELNGRRQTVSQWGRELGLKDNTIFKRVKLGWPAEQVLRPV